jgi:hypothetical protein
MSEEQKKRIQMKTRAVGRFSLVQQEGVPFVKPTGEYVCV